MSVVASDEGRRLSVDYVAAVEAGLASGRGWAPSDTDGFRDLLCEEWAGADAYGKARMARAIGAAAEACVAHGDPSPLFGAGETGPSVMSGVMAGRRGDAMAALLATSADGGRDWVCQAALDAWDGHDDDVLVVMTKVSDARPDGRQRPGTWLSPDVRELVESRAGRARPSGAGAERAALVSSLAPTLGPDLARAHRDPRAMWELWSERVGSPESASGALATDRSARLALMCAEGPARRVMDVLDGGNADEASLGADLAACSEATGFAVAIRTGVDPESLVPAWLPESRSSDEVALARLSEAVTRREGIVGEAVHEAHASGEAWRWADAALSAQGTEVPDGGWRFEQEARRRREDDVAEDASPVSSGSGRRPGGGDGDYGGEGFVIVRGIDADRVTFSRDRRVAQVCFDDVVDGRDRTISGWFPSALLSRHCGEDTWDLALTRGRSQDMTYYDRGHRVHIERTSEHLARAQEHWLSGPRAIDGHGRRPAPGQTSIDFGL